ncbi:AMP-binding protein [Streptomyces sp. BG9H]|uniref:AMP-binding protein n=2 Tax=Streptomyces anatolicus TaxID=2675858 RepID=A0ABS6YMT1_9ACTN|nr:AMP-binding protein [Streptomyces anatolicus]
MEWHFSPRTGSPYWLNRAKSLDFDPRKDVGCFADLALFPNVVNELRDVRIEDLIPRGYDGTARPVAVCESGGTTGAPKRVVLLEDWVERNMALWEENLAAHGAHSGGNWLVVMPSGPHLSGPFAQRIVRLRGGVVFTIDIDPRWVKRLIAAHRQEEAEAYAEHVVDQACHILNTQDVEMVMITPPLLQRLALREDAVHRVNDKVRTVLWGGAHLDPDTRFLLRREVFGRVTLIGNYGSTMALGSANERPGLTDDDPCVFDTLAPFVTYWVVDPDTRARVPYGERGQVVMHHVSRSAFVPNNLERDFATRVEPTSSSAGDAVADIAPVPTFDNATVIEGVY